MTTEQRILDLAMPPRRQFFVGVGFGVLSAGSAVALLAASAYLISASALRPPILYLMMVIVAVRAFALGRAFFRYLERLASHEAAFRTLGALRARIFEWLIPGAPSRLQTLGGGEVLAGVVSDVDQLQDLSLRLRLPLWAGLSVSLATVACVAVVSWPSALVLLGSLVIAFLLGGVCSARVAKAASAELSPMRARESDALLEYVDSMRVLRAFDADEVGAEAIMREDVDATRRSLRLSSAQAITGAVLAACSGAAVFGAIWIGSGELAWGAFDGTMLAVIVLVPLSVFDVFSTVPPALGVANRVRASARRLADVIGPVTEQRGAAASSNTHDRRARRFESLELDRVSIGWVPGHPVLHDISLSLTPGRRLLITGASGAGKSTLAAALVRFIGIERGSYSLNGIDVETLHSDEVREAVGLCEQTPHVFDSTIRANLRVADPEATDQRLWDALAEVGLADEVRGRGGLDTEVGEHGRALSGGQVQRLALARALLAQFPVIVFDEPTANVDPEQSAELLSDLLKISEAGTMHPAVVLISHDVVPLDLVDEQLRLPDPDDSRVVARPTM